MRLYKYLPAEHALAMVNSGRLLFRPPGYFRETEGDSARGDPHESRQDVFVCVDKSSDLSTLGRGEQRMLRRQLGRSFDADVARAEQGDKSHRYHGVAVIDSRESDRVLLFCTSRLLSGALLREFRADTVVEITDAVSFAERVRDAARQQVCADVECAVVGCHYGGSTISPDSKAARLPPFAVKGMRFAHQAETRFVLASRSIDFSARTEQFLTVPDLNTVCRIRALGTGDPIVQAGRVLDTRFGPNDPCPCGRGKKLKRCCGGVG